METAVPHLFLSSVHIFPEVAPVLIAPRLVVLSKQEPVYTWKLTHYTDFDHDDGYSIYIRNVHIHVV
jgi:hypothetical protein